MVRVVHLQLKLSKARGAVRETENTHSFAISEIYCKVILSVLQHLLSLIYGNELALSVL